VVMRLYLVLDSLALICLKATLKEERLLEQRLAS